MKRAGWLLALCAALAARAQTAPEPAPEPAPPFRPLPGETPPGRFMAELAIGGTIQLHFGRVNTLRAPPVLDAGFGIHFTPKWGAALSGRYGLNPLAGCCRRDAGWVTAGLLRNGRRESDYWGVGPAWRESSGSAGPFHRRGWAVVYRKNLHDRFWNTALTGELQCFPGQCTSGIGLSAGFYF